MSGELNASGQRALEEIRQLADRTGLDELRVDLMSFPESIIVGRVVFGASRRVLIHPNDASDPRDPRIEYALTWFADLPEDIEGKALGDLEHVIEWLERFLIDLEECGSFSHSIRKYLQDAFR